MKRVLTIAGSDTSGGAGIQVDLKVMADMGVYGLSVVTAVTAQNSKGVHKVNVAPPRVVAAQIDAVARDIGIDACKIGMLYSHQLVSEVAGRIARRKIPNVVLDPVLFAKDGTRLLNSKGVERMRGNLLPLVMVVTPNVPEAELMSGVKIASRKDMRAAALVISRLGPDYVLIKGGHLEGEPVDVLFDGKEFHEFDGTRVEGKNVHGTGCLFSSALASRLALGDGIVDAVRLAKEYTFSAIERAVRLGKGGMDYFPG